MTNITDLFIENCLKKPDNQALVINERYYSYSDLLHLIYPILNNLRDQKITNDKIAIYCSDDIETYTSILAVAIYGACFVPINSKNPITHSLNILKTSSIQYIIHSNNIELPNELNNFSRVVVNSQDKNNNLDLNLLKPTILQENSYLLHTSGSTGIPKGVAISHQQINTFFNFFKDNKRFNFTEKDRFIQPFELTFDVSIFTLFMPLNIGACCYIVPQNGMRFLDTIRIMRDHSITVATFVPTLLNHIEKYFKEFSIPSLKYSFFIGDKLIHSLTSKWKKVIPNAEIVNFYGPTEATVMCSYYQWEEVKSLNDSLNDVVPIGKLFPQIEYILINDENSLIDKTSLGELCLSGTQVIKGYLNQTNKDAFINLENGKLFYKTGDIVSINKNGDFIFHNRKDRQIKINSHRIELNEVESGIRKILSSPFSIIAIKNNKNLDELVLFIEEMAKKKINTNKLLLSLKTILPDFMTPKEIITVGKLPLNQNQKIDTKLLIDIYYKFHQKA